MVIARLTVLVLLLAAALHAANGQRQRQCYARDDNPYLFFGSKTAYEFSKDKTRGDDVPYCEPLQLWMLARHGTRFPSGNTISEMRSLPELRNQIIRNHEERRDGSLCEEDIENLKKWNLNVSTEQANQLSNQGHTDLQFIARRYKTKFSALLNGEYTPDRFTFRYTDTQRTRASAEAFASGLFGNAEGSTPLPPPVINDTLIEAYKNCSTWQRCIGDNPKTKQEQQLFGNTTQMQGLIRRVSERLGFKYTLKLAQIDLMYDMCRYDKAWMINELSPWCAVFTRDELKLMEYKEDLKYYCESGYGNEMNSKMGCPPVRDLMHRFSMLADNASEQPVGVFYFTHSTAVLQTLTTLGIAKDLPKLLHNNYESMQHREWQTSKIGPFATNIAAVFFKCSRGESHRVMFFLEERVVPFDGCEVGLCSWTFVKEMFHKPAHECSLDWCRDDYNSAARAAAAYTALLALIVVIVGTA